MLMQKARMNWIPLGDGNTKFFHQAIQRRRNVNTVLRLQHKGEWISDPSKIKEAFFEHYSDFFQNKHSTLLTLGSLSLPQLPHESKGELTKEFSSAEIECALAALADDKAPGPDGFNIRSLKFLWPFIKQKIEAFICLLYTSPSPRDRG